MRKCGADRTFRSPAWVHLEPGTPSAVRAGWMRTCLAARIQGRNGRHADHPPPAWALAGCAAGPSAPAVKSSCETAAALSLAAVKQARIPDVGGAERWSLRLSKARESRAPVLSNPLAAAVARASRVRPGVALSQMRPTRGGAGAPWFATRGRSGARCTAAGAIRSQRAHDRSISAGSLQVTLRAWPEPLRAMPAQAPVAAGHPHGPVSGGRPCVHSILGSNI